MKISSGRLETGVLLNPFILQLDDEKHKSEIFYFNELCLWYSVLRHKILGETADRFSGRCNLTKSPGKKCQ
jgi:hypothetical protein